MITALPLEARSIDIPPTATSGVSASNAVSASHSHRPSPTHPLHSEKQHKAPVGLIVGVALGIIAALCGLFFIRFLFVRRARRREAFAGPGKTLGGASSIGKGLPPQPPTYPTDMPMPMPSERDAVELGQYPPPIATNPTNPTNAPAHQTSGSWSTPFSGATPTTEPGAGSSPAARQAYLAAELRAAQSLLERGGKDVNTKQVKARIRALEERQQSAWALGLE